MRQIDVVVLLDDLVGTFEITTEPSKSKQTLDPQTANMEFGKIRKPNVYQDSPRIHTNSKTPLATVHFVVLAPGPKICKNTVEVLLQAARRIAIQAF